VTNNSSVCPHEDIECLRTVPLAFIRRVFVVYPSTTPQISAPLGWTLSRASRETMAEALTKQAAAPCAPDGGGLVVAYCTRGYGSLADLKVALTPTG
jgi:hypothetical protein